MKSVSIRAALIGCVVVYCHPLALAQTNPLAPGGQIASPAGTFTSNLIFRNGFELLTWRVLKSSTSSLLVVPCSSGQCPPQLGVESDVPQPADYNGDGIDDIATWRPLDATWRVLFTTTNTTLATVFGAPGDVPIAADYDGDGIDDRAVWNPIDGSWSVLRSSTGAALAVPCLNGFCGAFGDQPVRGDFDGDGKDDFAISRPSTASWIIQLNAGGGLVTQPWGAAGDIPIPADYDGDGRTDIAVWRPSNATWIIRSSASGVQYTPACASGLCTDLFGAAGDIPQVGDFDGDGRADLIVWRPSDGTWRRVNSTDGSHVIAAWGVNGDSPQPGDYDGDNKADLAVLQK
ncbi:MAG: VCBS repeat-containing protein [Dokdonella sp.]